MLAEVLPIYIVKLGNTPSPTEVTLNASQKTYDFAKKRYDVGLLGTFELITNQNNLNRAMTDKVVAQYEYVFRMKVLEFYKGQGIKL